MDIPDGNATGVDYPIPTPAAGTITDLNVCINITHTWPGDLKVTLTHVVGPATTSVVLMDRPGSLDPFFTTYGCNSLFPNVAVYLDDSATNWVDDTCPLVSNMKPHQPLSAFNGQSRSGTWTLTVADMEPLDTGQLTGVQLYFSP